MVLKKIIIKKLINFTLNKLILPKSNHKNYTISNQLQEQLNEKADYLAEQIINPIKNDTLEKIYQQGVTQKGQYLGQQFALYCVNKISKKINLYSYQELLINCTNLFEILNKIEENDIRNAIIQLKHNLFLKFPDEKNKELNEFSYTILLEALKKSNTRHNKFIHDLLKKTLIYFTII